MILFLDRNIEGRVFSQELMTAGFEIRKHCDHFDYKEKDEVWIPVVASYGWIIVSTDKKIRKRDSEIGAIAASSAKMIRVPMAGANIHALADNFVRSKKQIEAFVINTSAPFIAVLRRPSSADTLKNKPGIIELRYPYRYITASPYKTGKFVL